MLQPAGDDQNTEHFEHLTDRSEQLKRLRQERGGFKSVITRKEREIRELMWTSTSDVIGDIEQRLDQIRGTFGQFDKVQSQYIDLVQDDPAEALSAEAYSKTLTEGFEQLQSDFKRWLELKGDNAKEDSIVVGESASQTGKSKASHASSTSSLLVRAKAQKAALLAQAECLRRTQTLEAKKLEFEQEVERLKLQGKIKSAEAEELVYAEYESLNRENPSKPLTLVETSKKHTVNKSTTVPLNPIAPPWPTEQHMVKPDVSGENMSSGYEREIIRQSVQQQRQMLFDLQAKMDRMCRQTSHDNNYEESTRIENEANNLQVLDNPAFTPQPLDSGNCNTPEDIRPQLGAGLPTSERPSTDTQTRQQVGYVNNSFIQLQQTMLDAIHMPRAELVTFEGDPLTYWTFIRSFESSVDRSDLSDASKLCRLFQYCKGYARQVIDCCAIMEPAEGYREAKRLLFHRFGNQFTISKAWISRITEGGSIKPNDGRALRNYADDVRSCVLTLSAMGRLGEMDNQDRMVQIITKLPFFLQSQWRKHAVRHLREKGLYPDVTHLVDFIETAAQEATDPVFGGAVGNQTSELGSLKRKPQSSQSKGMVFSVQARSMGKSGLSPMHQVETFSCHFCSGSHALLKCDAFQNLPSEKRFDYVREKRLCYNCFSPKHWSNICPKDSRCLINGCTRNHSRLLHDYMQNSKFSGQQTGVMQAQNSCIRLDGLTFQATGAGAIKVALPVVPVKVKRPSEGYLETYALLDSGSTNTFCSTELLETLGVKGRPACLSLTTLEKKSSKADVIIAALQVTDAGERQSICLPRVFATPKFPVLKENVATLQDIRGWSHLSDIPFPERGYSKVSLIIGQDVPEALIPVEVRRGNPGEPYATKTILGWSLNGPMGHRAPYMGMNDSSSNFVQAKDDLAIQVEKFWKLDSCPAVFDKHQLMSKNDRKVVDLWESTTEFIAGHYQMRIPFRNTDPCLPNNYSVAETRLQALGRKLSRDPEKMKKYKSEIDGLIDMGFAERVTETEAEIGKVWYLPHHGVTNVNKPGKLRVVFDCAATFGGVSLNSEVLQGPDLSNKLLGVLLRFRQNPVAIMGDVEAMFHQVRVHPDDRDVLRFLWWQHGDPSQPVEVFRMTVHLFGGVWSPSCANFALKLTATDHRDDYHQTVCETVYRNFYVDDCLKSLPTCTQAIGLVKDLCSMLMKGGFILTKWISNSRSVLESVPTEKRAKGVKTVDLDQEPLPLERALGVQWDTDTDTFGYNINPKDRPTTRRGILSVMSSVYDPLGFVCPYILLAKCIFQSETKKGKAWDSPLDANSISSWNTWIDNLQKLEQFSVPRCLLPVAFGKVKAIQLHHFSDASNKGYGVASYVRFESDTNAYHCSLIVAKSRLAPIKAVTIPRLELSAAVLAAQMDDMLRHNLDLQLEASTFWTDSEIVLRYINNKDKRFQTFVANRISQIHELSGEDQWKFVSSGQNPADDASRGLNADALLESARWVNGPQFLWQDASLWPEQPSFNSTDEDMEIKRDVKVCQASEQREDSVSRLLLSFSSWHRLKKAVAWLLRFRTLLLSKVHKQKIPQEGGLTVKELLFAERQIIRIIQEQAFDQELQDLRTKDGIVRKTSALLSLEPKMTPSGTVCIGGRLGNSPTFVDAKHQMILPKNHHVGTLIIRDYHERNGHMGKEYVLAQIRQKFWIIGARRQVARVLKDCIPCKRRQMKPEFQRMADLPSDRVTPGRPPFTYTGVDCFGPFTVKRGRSQVKRYGCLFTCLTVRAIHLEKLDSLNTDSFVNGLKRFESRRGRPEKIRSDNGTNFTSGERELREGIQEWNQSVISEHLRQKEIQWVFNPPCASHMGGSWERQIRTVRKVLRAMSSTFSSLDDEGLNTLFCEVESIVNSRPITMVSDDPRDLDPLTPNSLLLLGSLPRLPSGTFTLEDQYRKQWRHVQQLANAFWKRWLKEYLPTIQLRQKWFVPKRNLRDGDIVLVLDENTPRGVWPLGRVTVVFPGKDGLVRSAEVRTRGTVLTRPTHKLCLLESVP